MGIDEAIVEELRTQALLDAQEKPADESAEQYIRRYKAARDLAQLGLPPDFDEQQVLEDFAQNIVDAV